MAAAYLKRAGTETKPTPPPADAVALATGAPNPWGFVALTVAVPIVVVMIGWALLQAVSIQNSTGYILSYKDVRAAITQVLDKDLTEDRIRSVLAELPDPTPGADDNAKEERKTEREAQLKMAAARISGERAKLADALTTVALVSHPAIDACVASGAGNAERRKAMATVVTARLNGNDVQATTKTWAGDALDSRATAAIEKAIGKSPAGKESATGAIAKSITVPALTAATNAAVALAFNPFDTKPGESAWTSDVSARLAWATVSLVFTLTFLLVVATCVAQMWLIEQSQRVLFGLATLAAAVGTGAAAYQGFDLTGLTPLHAALESYARLLHVAIPAWGNLFNILRGTGVALLIAGAVATFLVECTTADDLNEQLRGFKTLFNTGTVFLMTGTFEMYAEFRWPAVFAADDSTRSALQGAAAALAATVGVAFSAVTLATYFATTAVLRRQALAHGVPVADVVKAFETAGFGDLTSNQVLRFAQALLPLLPGALTVLAT